MAFLDEKGTGGIFTQKHVPKTEGVTGKYEGVNDYNHPIEQEGNKRGNVMHQGGGVSFQRFNPTKNPIGTETPMYIQDLNSALAAQDHDMNPNNHFNPTHGRNPLYQNSGFKGEIRGSHRFRLPESQQSVDSFNPTNYESTKNTEPLEPVSYQSKNNRYAPPRQDHSSLSGHRQEKVSAKQRNYPSPSNRHATEYTNQNYDNPIPSINHIDQKTYNLPPSKKGGNFLTFPTESPDSNGSILVSIPTEASQPKRKYHSQRTHYNNRVIHPQVTSLEDVSFPFTQPEYDDEPPSKERRSRDLTLFGVDGNIYDITSQSELSRPSAALRLLEEQLSPVSTEDAETRSRSRHNSRGANSSEGRKYKEITRNPSSQSDESNYDRKDRALEVKVQEDEVNVRHPFLPRDSKGENIDYVKLRMEYDATTVPIKERIRDEYDLVPEVMEKPQTTTTPKTTTEKTTPPTTTEYVPEDPAETLKRLKHNPFLASIFPHSDTDDAETAPPEPATTTTPKITTYRAKTTTAVLKLVESPEENLDRLRSNPFLSTLQTNPEKMAENVQTKRRRGSRKRPIIVVPDMPSDTEKDVKHVEQLTLAQYSGPSHGLMYKTISRRTQQRMTDLAEQLNNEGLGGFHIVVRRSADTKQTKEADKPSTDATSDAPVDDDKYPFYNSPASVTFPLYSPVRYALNPKDIPVKTSGGMEFYESRDRSVICIEPSPPKDIVPKRGKDGEWNKNPQHDKPRLGKLGDQIDCLKAKYFGADPLDNPFFKESKVEVPNFKPKSSDDGFGFHADIVENIKTEADRVTDQVFEGKNKKASQDNIGGFSSNSRPNGVQPKQKLPIYTYKNMKSKNTGSLKAPYDANLKKDVTKNHGNSRAKLTNQTYNDIKGSDYLKEFHHPQRVSISIKSKGTLNHPKIKRTKDPTQEYNEAIKVFPRSTMGYLKSHVPLHIINYPKSGTRNLFNKNTDSVLLLETLGLKNPMKTQKLPTKVSYIILNNVERPHQQPRTPVTAIFYQPNPKTSTKMDNSQKASNIYFSEKWKRPALDEIRGEPKYRVKRNDENDKYINSKESIELKNFLLQKYANILAKETPESKKESRNQNSKPSQSIETNHSSLSATSTGSNRNRLPYSSRYSASDPMHESSSTEVEISNEKKEPLAQEHPIVSRFPTRKPKLRFPKLTLSPRPTNEKERVKYLNIPEVVQIKTITTTTTTTPAPPSTTTRMYKPRVVYKKEYGKPLDKVVNMFEVLKQRPKSNDEYSFIPSTERIQDITTLREEMVEPARKPNRKFKPKRLEQFEHRRITKEEVFKKTYSPEDYARERSDIVEVYDHGFEHPDLEGPISRMSRDSPAEYSPPPNFHDMLVYMVDPLTGAGEWKVIPVALSAVSRVDPNFQSLVRDPAIAQQALIQSSQISKQRKKETSKQALHQGPPAVKPVKDPPPEPVENTEYRYASRQRESTTEPHKKPRSKSRRKLRPDRNQVFYQHFIS